MPDVRQLFAWLLAAPSPDQGPAWSAVGVVAASPAALRQLIATSVLIDALPNGPASVAKGALTAAWSDAEKPLLAGDSPSIKWTIPDSANIQNALRIPATVWAAEWRATQPAEYRLRVLQPQPDDAPSISLLEGTGALVSMVAPLKARQLILEWPLRVAAFPDWPGLAGIAGLWPSNTLCRPVTIDRGQQESDILVHVGTLPELFDQAARLPFKLKTDLLIYAGPATPDIKYADIDDALRLFDASGVVMLDPAARLDVMTTLNGIVNNLSHNHPFDAAVCGALKGSGALGYMTEALADARLSKIAQRINTRLTKLSPGASIDLSNVRSGTYRTSMPRGRSTARAEINLESLRFDHESDAASDLARMSTAIEAAVEPRQVSDRRAERFLQQQSFSQIAAEMQPAVDGFQKDVPALINVRIGPPESGWQAIDRPFDTSVLPKEERAWELDVWLTEATQLERGIRRSITLTRDGASSVAAFPFTPRYAGRFDARITVLHRGRVLQTATLSAGVRMQSDEKIDNAAPVMSEPLRVRKQIDGLDQRRQFDLAVVLNHNGAHTPQAVSIAADAAGVSNLTQALQISAALNTILSRLGQSTQDYDKGVRNEHGRVLLRDAAREGSALLFNLFNQDIDAKNNKLRGCEYIQVVNTESGSLVPFELIYDRPFPDDDAEVCPTWEACVTAGQCSQPETTATICPAGFWGISKVIERWATSSQLMKDGNRLFVQNVPQRGHTQLKMSGTCLVANSTRVTVPIKALLDELQSRTGFAPEYAASWQEWQAKVSTAHPTVLIAMPHSGGSGSGLSLEIGGKPLYSLQILKAHVGADESHHPLVALLGCDTGNSAGDYLNHVAIFQDRGAAVVIGTIATVFGDHAPRVAEQLARVIIPLQQAPPTTVGEAMRSLRRQALLDDFLLPLCIVAFGDADWELVH
jgi:hypothetical protein